MDPKIAKKFQALENQRNDLLNELNQLTPEQLSFSPVPDRWSIEQVLYHLIQSEQGTMQYLGKKIQAEALPRAGLVSAVKSLSLTIALRSPLKFKAPQRIAPPQQPPHYGELVREWENIRQSLGEFLEVLPRERNHSVIFRHPVIGYINIFQTLRFLQEHIAHHIKQIQRIRSAPNFPSGG